MAAFVLCGAMARKVGQNKESEPAPEDMQATKERYRRLRQVRDKLKPTPAMFLIKPKSPPAKRSKKQHQEEHIRRRGKGSGSGTAKSSGSKDVVVLSDVEGSESKIRGRGEEPAVQHEPAVKKKNRGRGEVARVLTKSTGSRMKDTGTVFDARVKELVEKRRTPVYDKDVDVSLSSLDDGCDESRSCDGGEKPVRTKRNRSCGADEGERGLKRTKAKDDASSSEDSSEPAVVGKKAAPPARADDSSDEYTYYSSYESSESDESPRHRYHPAVAGNTVLPVPPPPPPPVQAPPPLPPLPPPQEDPERTRPCVSKGAVSYIHLDVEAKADIDELAADTRNQGGVVVMAICADSKQAQIFGTALNKDGFGIVTRGDGVKGRSPPSEYQEKYLYVIAGRIVIAGRQGVVKDIRHHLMHDCPGRGKMLIAQLDFTIGIADSLHLRVAAIAANTAVAVADDDTLPLGEKERFWNSAVAELLDKSVRVLVYKDSSDAFRETLRQRIVSTQISEVCGRGPSFFVLGPCDSVWGTDGRMVSKIFTYYPPEGSKDMSSKWPSLGTLKLKESHTTVVGSTCTYCFLGSERSRRSEAKIMERKVKNDKKWWSGRGSGWQQAAWGWYE